MAQKLTLMLVLTGLLSITSIAATSNDSTATTCPKICGSRHPPQISPCWIWGSDFCPQDVSPIVYTGQEDRDQTYTCTDPQHKGQTFNLAKKINCETQLSQDLYGWGVRVGFYTNWIASVFANVFLHEEIVSTIDANAIFLFALEIAAAKAVSSTGWAMRVDALIFYLVGMGTAVGPLSLWGRRTRFYYTDDERTSKTKSEFGGLGTYSRLLLCFFQGLFGLWFWYSPYRHGVLVGASCDPRCGSAYIFGTHLQSGIHWLFFTFTLLCEVYWTFLLVLLPICLIPQLRARWRNGSTRMHDLISRFYKRTPLSRLLTGRSGIILPACNFLWYIFIITLIEVTLHQNRALGTLASSPASSSPAQLIPMLIGVITLVRLIWSKFTEGYKDKKTIQELRPFIVYEDIRAQSDASELDPVAPGKTSA